MKVKSKELECWVKKTDHRIRQSDEAMNEKPLEAIGKESHESSHEENHPEREMDERET